MFQALIRTMQHQTGHYTLVFDTREERDEYVRRPDVWWYFYPEEHEFSFGMKKGGAWKSPAAQPGDETAPAEDGERW